MSSWLGLVCECWAVLWEKAVAIEGRTKEWGRKDLEKALTRLFSCSLPSVSLLPFIIKEKICERHSPHSTVVRNKGERLPGAR